MIEDEMHFITNCKINQVERDILYSNIIQVDQSFMDLHAIDKLFTCFRVEIHRFWPGGEPTKIVANVITFEM